MSQSVAIFRKRLLSYSETFIADQGQNLIRFQPLYCGYCEDNSGLALIDGSARTMLCDHSRMSSLRKLSFRLGISLNCQWLETIRQHQPNLVHAHFFNDGLDALQLGKSLGLPVLTTVHGHDITKYVNATAKNAKTKRFFERVDAVIAVSDFIAKQALARGCPEQKLIQHYIGIDLDKFTLPKQESDTASLLFVGRLVEKKGCTYLLQAMEQLKPKFPELRLTVIGDGELRPVLEQEARTRQLQVDFIGTATATEIRDRLAQSWLFVAPSITAACGDTEGLGMVFLEAQALQTPVVSFRSGGLVEAVEDQKTALLCEERDVNGLADNIASLLEDSSRRFTMGVAGRQRVEQNFNVRKQCAKLEAIYDRLG